MSYNNKLYGFYGGRKAPCLLTYMLRYSVADTNTGLVKSTCIPLGAPELLAANQSRHYTHDDFKTIGTYYPWSVQQRPIRAVLVAGTDAGLIKRTWSPFEPGFAEEKIIPLILSPILDKLPKFQMRHVGPEIKYVVHSKSTFLGW